MVFNLVIPSNDVHVTLVTACFRNQRVHHSKRGPREQRSYEIMTSSDFKVVVVALNHLLEQAW